jgi:formate hydrogenlyase subunit 3/multisubunit Na+/H+ antiporter MnhD subunit
MNKFYGMRTKNTFKSDESWLHLNEVGGMIFALIGFPLIFAGVLKFVILQQHMQIFAIMVLIVSFLSIVAAIYLFSRY